MPAPKQPIAYLQSRSSLTCGYVVHRHWIRESRIMQGSCVALSGVLAHSGSGYEQAEAELCRVEGDEIAVALGPPA